MATVTTVAETKRALLDEIQNLAIASDVAASPTSVQVTYSKPPVDVTRNESVYFGNAMNTVGEPEQRLTTGRRRRMMTWEVELIVQSSIRNDAEDAEARAFVIASAIETFLAANAQPSEWTTTSVASGALYVLVAAMESEIDDTVEGYKAVMVTLHLEMKERLT